MNLVLSQVTPSSTSSYQLSMKFISLDDGWEVRGVFLYISKAFDKVWHEGLLRN